MNLKSAELPNLILKRVITEKSVRMQGDNQHTFIVRRDADKNNIRQAIEEIFGVAVERVNIVNMKPTSKYFRQRKGASKAFKKAYVTLKQGDNIEFSEVN